MHYAVVVQYNGYVQTSYTQGSGFSPAAVFVTESFLYKPDGSHITNVWDIALLNNGAEGTDYVTSCGYPSSWCAYIWSENAPETGTYWLGGGFGTGVGGNYNDQGGSSAAAIFGQTGGSDFATVGWFAMS
jgi:hypothetical protein